MVALVVLGALVASDPDSSPPPRPPSSGSVSAPSGTYGSDPVLDELQDRCSAGDRDACDELYWGSPVGSEYEAYAQRERRGTASGGPSDGSLVLALVWAEMTNWERDEACAEYRAFGRAGARELAEASEGAVTTAEAVEFFDERC